MLTNKQNQINVKSESPCQQQQRWRKDFPIDWPQDRFIARRDFTKFMVLISLAFVFGQFWILIQNFLRQRRGKLPLRAIAKINEIPVGGAKTFSYTQEYDSCVLVRLDANTFVAYSQECTHLSCSVVPKVERGCFQCPCHEGYFDIANGRPLSGPPRRPLPRIKLKLQQDTIYAQGVELRMI
ncbi:MAG: Rieske 2Fe-2S domain-containing protein [Acidobacteriota bacterium]